MKHISKLTLFLSFVGAGSVWIHTMFKKIGLDYIPFTFTLLPSNSAYAKYLIKTEWPQNVLKNHKKN